MLRGIRGLLSTTWNPEVSMPPEHKSVITKKIDDESLKHPFGSTLRIEDVSIFHLKFGDDSLTCNTGSTEAIFFPLSRWQYHLSWSNDEEQGFKSEPVLWPSGSPPPLVWMLSRKELVGLKRSPSRPLKVSRWVAAGPLRFSRCGWSTQRLSVRSPWYVLWQNGRARQTVSPWARF